MASASTLRNSPYNHCHQSITHQQPHRYAYRKGFLRLLYLTVPFVENYIYLEEKGMKSHYVDNNNKQFEIFLVKG